MNNLQWSAMYSVGIAKIDKQHQELFALIDELQFLLDKSWSRANVKHSFDRFVQKALTHFSDEESYMELFQYHSKESHIKAHQALARKALDLQAQQDAQTINLTPELADFLEDWLTRHVDGADRALGEFLQENGLV
jgi:hemerythrin